MSKSLKLRLEEYVPAASFLKTSFTRDRAELEEVFSEFTSGYETEFGVQLETVRTLEQSLVLTEEQKSVTRELNAAAYTLNKELNVLSFQFKRANMDTAVMTKVKKELAKGNIEGACQKVDAVVQLLANKSDTLQSKGMKTTYGEELAAKSESLLKKNVLQKRLMDSRGQLTEVNKAKYKQLLDYISTISQAGKILYDGFKKEDEYTMTKLISRMRAPKRDDGTENI